MPTAIPQIPPPKAEQSVHPKRPTPPKNERAFGKVLDGARKQIKPKRKEPKEAAATPAPADAGQKSAADRRKPRIAADAAPDAALPRSSDVVQTETSEDGEEIGGESESMPSSHADSPTLPMVPAAVAGTAEVEAAAIDASPAHAQLDTETEWAGAAVPTAVTAHWPGSPDAEGAQSDITPMVAPSPNPPQVEPAEVATDHVPVDSKSALPALGTTPAAFDVETPVPVLDPAAAAPAADDAMEAPVAPAVAVPPDLVLDVDQDATEASTYRRAADANAAALIPSAEPGNETETSSDDARAKRAPTHPSAAAYVAAAGSDGDPPFQAAGVAPAAAADPADIPGLAQQPESTPPVKSTAAQSVRLPDPLEARFAETNHPRIVTAVQSELMPSGGTVRLRLDPPELGALQVRIDVRDGVLAASFQTSNDEATRLLTRSLQQLKTTLESQGVTVEKLHVHQTPRDQWDGNRGGGDRDQQSPQHWQQQEQQRREMLQRMWRRVRDGRDPFDLVA